MPSERTARLRRLPPETFGERLRRARRTSGVNLRDAATLITDEIGAVSHTTLASLETFAKPPATKRRRRMACLAVLAYGYEPDDFGLSRDDLPASIDQQRFIGRVKDTMTDA